MEKITNAARYSSRKRVRAKPAHNTELLQLLDYKQLLQHVLKDCGQPTCTE
jgi:hypothetical protein